MSWQIYIFISIFLASISTLLQRTILKEDNSHPLAYSIFFQLVCGLIIMFWGIITHQLFINPIDKLIPQLILMIFAYGFGNAFIFKALKITESSQFTVIFATRMIFTVITSLIFLGELISIKQILGAALIFFSVFLVSFKSKKIKFGKGEIFTLLAAALFGIANTNDRFLLQNMNLYYFLSLGFIVPAIFMGAIYPKTILKFKLFLNKKTLKNMLVMIFIYSFTAITFFSALQKADNATQVVSVNLIQVVLTVLLAIIFLKEKNQMKEKVAGAGLSLAGLLMLTI